MTIRIATICFLTSFLFSCNQTQKTSIVTEKVAHETVKKNVFYHYSIWWAFVNKVFEGDITAEELKTKGDMALGSYNLLDGELIMLDGILYQAKENGEVLVPNDSIKVAYANAAFFDKDGGFKLDKINNYEALRTEINSKLPSINFFYAFKVKGDFKKMKCGGLHKQEPPFETGLDVLIPSRPVFERENFSGTMVGFYCPEFIGNINVAGFHFHFVSDDKKFAGHVMEFEAENLVVEFDKMNKYQFVLPETEAYENVGFDKEFQYKKK
tara:strand:- start:229 stop:1032 length:804 start_codon:yes stop_codon:yes gene_type:complete